jgi:hypothetical protein
LLRRVVSCATRVPENPTGEGTTGFEPVASLPTGGVTELLVRKALVSSVTPAHRVCPADSSTPDLDRCHPEWSSAKHTRHHGSADEADGRPSRTRSCCTAPRTRHHTHDVSTPPQLSLSRTAPTTHDTTHPAASEEWRTNSAACASQRNQTEPPVERMTVSRI